MNPSQMPSVELVQGPGDGGPARPRRGNRWKLFFVVLVVGLLVGLAIVYGRSPVYRASASVLTVKPKAIDTRSAEADLEHVAIQGRLLSGEVLLGRLAERTGDAGDPLTVDALRGMLDVVAVPDTNLLELRAQGAIPEQLQRVVNSWAETYQSYRAEEIEALSGRTIAEIQDAQRQLEAKIAAARAELQTFRAEHDIVSLERSENRSLSGLKGLNASLNKARERLIETEARKAAIDDAIGRGETVVPDAQKAEIGKLQLAVQRARVRLSELRSRYTEVYIERDPATKDLPARVRTLERELRLALQLATRTVSDEAQQAVEAARLTVERLERELDTQQQRVQQFTGHFKAFKGLEEALARLEELYADNQARLARIEVQNLEKYPPIEVVDWARVPTEPIHPDYDRDLLIAIAGALALALFVTWLREYLSSAPAAAEGPQLGIRIYPAGRQAPALDDTGPAGQLTASHEAPRSLGQPANADLPQLPRELAPTEIQALLATTDRDTRAHAMLLLNGVSPYELPLLHAQCFDQAARRVALPGASRRSFEVSEGHWQLIAPLVDALGASQMPTGVAGLNASLADAAAAAGIGQADNVDALALWHTYVLYLVRQGIDTSALTDRVGAIPSAVHQALQHFAPPGGNRPLSGITFEYPALAA